MFIMCDEMWNSVQIYGRQAEIDRFKRLCIVPGPANDWEDNERMVDFSRAGAIYIYAWNFRDHVQREPGVYRFAFDTEARFPISTLERLAVLFPGLAFDCECIADDDRSMGYGWFNTPLGGEDFCDDYDVPEGYWDRGGGKRTAEAERRHMAVIAAFKRSFQQMDNGK